MNGDNDMIDLNTEEDIDEENKIHISRVPTKFCEDIVKRILQDKLGENTVQLVELIYPRDDSEGAGGEIKYGNEGGEETTLINNNKNEGDDEGDAANKEHRGFGFVSFSSRAVMEKALELETIKGGRKATSKKLHTLYLRPYHGATTTNGNDDNDDPKNLCYLWLKNRCPYGDDCKFVHAGPGGCIIIGSDKKNDKKKRGKCFAFKKGKCTKGDDCPFSHDFEPKLSKKASKTRTSNDESDDNQRKDILKSEKDCINWKTKGKCRKGDKCPYRHDKAVQTAALEKLAKKRKRKLSGDNRKEKQPLSVRVFGMNYETTEQDIREFLKDCGPIHNVEFPTFEDSGRSKGYCGVWFSSPKAVQKATQLDGQELMGRWLSIQAGKMYLKQWEDNASKRAKTTDTTRAE